MIIDQDEEYWKNQKEHDDKLKESNKENVKEWRKNNKNKMENYIRKNQLKKNYGITPEQYDELFIQQKGRCAICGRHQTEFKNRLSIDHDHVTGKVRALLCTNCNFILGNAKDDMTILLSAIKYLEKYNDFK
jgi:hypothetical protein